MRTSPPSVAPLSSCSTSRSTSCTLGVGSDNEHRRNSDNSVSAVSFGLVATAILICIFLVMALFERDYPSNKLSNHREHRCNFQKLGTIGVILQNHMDYPCILLFFIIICIIIY
ncbi:hypothetical protein HanRHA438_Chr12g0541431 [Helianthus annuus]|nr:hypothetical protein HanRHA438_Chr12g0541431 [Helianthus annuus]